jgi:hypothetical protein
MNVLGAISSFISQLMRSPEEQAQEEREQQYVFPIPKPHEIDPIYFTCLHKTTYPDHLFKWLFCEISEMENGWLRMENDDPVSFNEMLNQKAKEDVEISTFLCYLNGSAFNGMMAELRNLTITGFPTKYLIPK